MERDRASALRVSTLLIFEYDSLTFSSRVYPDEGQQEDVRVGYAPDEINPNQPHGSENFHNVDEPLHEDEGAWRNEGTRDEEFHRRDYSAENDGNVWGEDGAGNPSSK
jgi:hypothetical protein